MTVDLAFVAVFVWVCYRSSWLPLALLSLVRETGLVAVAAGAGWHIYHRRWRLAAVVASSGTPFALWALLVSTRFEMRLWQWLPDRAPYARTVEDLTALASGLVAAGLAAEFVALAGQIYSGWLTFRALAQNRETPQNAMGALFAVLGLYRFALGD